MRQKKVLVIGIGEIGSALVELEKEADNLVETLDVDHFPQVLYYDVTHVCIPYSEKFVKTVNDYLSVYPSKLVIVHSTVKVGTCEKLKGSHFIVHSPVMGKHPHIKTSLLTFPKFVGGSADACLKAKKHFKFIGVHAQQLGDYRTTELAKLLSTSFYGWMLSFMDRADKLCEQYGIDYDAVVTEWTKAYNKGNKKMGANNYTRPLLTSPKGHIGGHCVIPNARLLDDEVIKNEIIQYE